MKSFSDKVVSAADFNTMTDRVAKAEMEVYNVKRKLRLTTWIGSAVAIVAIALALFH